MKVTKKTRLLAAPLLFHDTVTGVTIRTAIPDGGCPIGSERRSGSPEKSSGKEAEALTASMHSNGKRADSVRSSDFRAARTERPARLSSTHPNSSSRGLIS